MKIVKPIYYIGLIISMLVGVWHFFVPYLYGWYTYIPNQYQNLIVGIDYTNFFFSLLLTGLSLLLTIQGKKFFVRNKEIFIFYGFLVFVWLSRAIMTFVEPWPLEPIKWAAYGQQIMAFVLLILLTIPFAYLMKNKKT